MNVLHISTLELNIRNNFGEAEMDLKLLNYNLPNLAVAYCEK
jgi:hypothetical protein